MNLKTLLIVVALLAVLSVGVYVAQRPEIPAVADARVGQPLADRPAIEKAAKLRLADQGKSVTLVRQPDGTWRVADYFDLPADFAKLTGFVGSLTEARLQRLVTASPERIARLEFKDTKVELLDAAGTAFWTVTLGKNAETGGGRYVRYGTEDKAFLTNYTAWLDAEPKNWADSQILTLKPDEIAKVEIPFADSGPVTVSRSKKDEGWTADKTPSGQRLKADRVAALLGSIGSVRFSDTVGPADAGVAIAHAHERTFKLTTFAGKTYTIALGRKPEEKHPKPPAATTTPPSPADGPKVLPGANGAGGTVVDLKPPDAKPAEPEFDIVPAGPVFAFVASSDPAAPINALMQKRAFQISDYTFTGLPQKPEEIFEPIPAPPPAAPAKAEEPKKP
jgi:hypothetical protein